MRKCFTLIELLVAIAIIGILVSILMPSLAKARDKAYVTVCLNNLKQFGIAAISYSADQDGEIPQGQPNYKPHTGNGSGMGFRAIYSGKWRGPGLLLKLGFVTKELFYCPKENVEVDRINGQHGLDTLFPDGVWDSASTYARYSYHWQGNYKEPTDLGWGRTLKPDIHDGGAVLMPEHFANIISPELHHGKKINVLYLDGGAVHMKPPADIRSRINNVTDWENINTSFRRLDR